MLFIRHRVVFLYVILRFNHDLFDCNAHLLFIEHFPRDIIVQEDVEMMGGDQRCANDYGGVETNFRRDGPDDGTCGAFGDVYRVIKQLCVRDRRVDLSAWSNLRWGDEETESW